MADEITRNLDQGFLDNRLIPSRGDHPRGYPDGGRRARQPADRSADPGRREAVYGDKAYASEALRTKLAAAGIEDRVTYGRPATRR